jgi:hypothetical protein
MNMETTDQKTLLYIYFPPLPIVVATVTFVIYGFSHQVVQRCFALALRFLSNNLVLASGLCRKYPSALLTSVSRLRDIYLRCRLICAKK